MIGIVDQEIAWAFDLECNEVLTEWEISLATAGQLAATGAMFGGEIKEPERKVERW